MCLCAYVCFCVYGVCIYVCVECVCTCGMFVDVCGWYVCCVYVCVRWVCMGSVCVCVCVVCMYLYVTKSRGVHPMNLRESGLLASFIYVVDSLILSQDLSLTGLKLQLDQVASDLQQFCLSLHAWIAGTYHHIRACFLSREGETQEEKNRAKKGTWKLSPSLGPWFGNTLHGIARGHSEASELKCNFKWI